MNQSTKLIQKFKQRDKKAHKFSYYQLSVIKPENNGFNNFVI